MSIDPLDTSVPLVEAEVVFDQIQEPPLMILPENVVMPAGLALLKFNLVGDASFLTHPLQWMQNEYGLSLSPPSMRVTRLDPQTVVVLSDNRTPRGQAKTFDYLLMVFSGGRIYSSDPTIINIPPVT